MGISINNFFGKYNNNAKNKSTNGRTSKKLLGPPKTGYTKLVCHDYIIYRNLFQVNWSLLSKVIKEKQQKIFLDLDQILTFFGSILLITHKPIGQIKSYIHQIDSAIYCAYFDIFLKL